MVDLDAYCERHSILPPLPPPLNANPSNHLNQPTNPHQVSSSTGETTYLWTGDRWMQSPDGLKGHEPQFWAPLQFDAEGRIEEMQWVDTFVLDVDVDGEPFDGEEGEDMVAAERV